MPAKTALKILFACIFTVMVLYSGWATGRQSLLQWGGLTTGIDRYWTIATLMDAYCGFLTFYVWVFYKESGFLPRALWFIAIMAFGNIAMSSYLLLQLFRLRPGQDVTAMLLRDRP